MIDYSRFLSRPAVNSLSPRSARMGTVVAGTTDLVSFAPGYPDPTLFPWDELRDISAALLNGADADTSPVRADARLRAAARSARRALG